MSDTVDTVGLLMEESVCHIEDSLSIRLRGYVTQGEWQNALDIVEKLKSSITHRQYLTVQVLLLEEKFKDFLSHGEFLYALHLLQIDYPAEREFRARREHLAALLMSGDSGAGGSFIVDYLGRHDKEKNNEQVLKVLHKVLHPPPPARLKELQCQWGDCTAVLYGDRAFVAHVNDHISHQADYRCLWKECERDGKAFQEPYMLILHARRHTGDKPHTCTYEGCKKRYSRLENLKIHLRTHVYEKPYACNVENCGKSFSNASERAKHQNRTHSDVKRYKCPVEACYKRYTDPSALRKHVGDEHGKTAWQIAQENKKRSGRGGSYGLIRLREPGPNRELKPVDVEAWEIIDDGTKGLGVAVDDDWRPDANNGDSPTEVEIATSVDDFVEAREN